MTAAGRTDDRRVRRTRRELRDALVSLILERGWDEVTVQQVCERADIGRSTFYVHFADKEELLLSGFDDLHAALNARRTEGDGSFAFVRDLVLHAKDNQRLMRALIGKRSGQAVQRRFREVVLRLTEAELEQRGVDAERRTHVARYVSGGLVELLLAWLDRPAALDVEELVTLFHRLGDGTVSAAKSEPSAKLSTRARGA